MRDQTEDRLTKGRSERLVLYIKVAYWTALLIVAAMAMASFILLQQMLAAHQFDSSLLSLTSNQKALSQRIVLLANAIDKANPESKSELVARLKAVTTEFEGNYREFLSDSGIEHGRLVATLPATMERVLFAKPYYLDYFSTGLVANAKRLIAEAEQEIAPNQSSYLGGSESARLNETLARATLAGYAALEAQITAATSARLAALLTTHRDLFFATIGIIVLVALFIFRPLAEVVRKRTRELVDARNSMAFLAGHDSLTGLYNRNFLRDHLDALIERARRRQERLAVVQIDLDHFKQVNDTLGHPIGDLVLARTAERIKAACRAADICVRLGGDEFVVVLDNVGTPEDISVTAQRIIQSIGQPITVDGVTVQPGSSAGVAVYPVDAGNRVDLFVHADLALYAAKKEGRGSLVFYSDELRAELRFREKMEHDIRHAITAGSFTVYFQPQVSLRSSRIAGIEALVRWKHPERGMVPPGEFVPIAEKSGLMVDIGRIVMHDAIHAAAEWHRAGFDFGRLAVNVSGVELREADFADFLFDTLENACLPARKIALEIVESVVLDDDKAGVAAKLRAIRARGVQLELDDFGTGYASLSHVNPHEFDRLKIDQRFVRNIALGSDNAKIVRAITDLARGLGIGIVAEGAETDGELSTLMAIGCDQVQGFAIAAPMPADLMREWLNTQRGKLPLLRPARHSAA